ncbi:MAG: hypothetical protein QM674_14905 [Burkholderiaceae bacterium]
MLAVLALLAWLPAGHAQTAAKKPTTLYSCRDDSGRVLSSDRPIVECANQPLREMNANGITTRNIPAPLTPEQLRRKADSDERARVQALRERQEKSRDRALLLTYENPQALEAARRRQIADLNHEISLARSRMIASHREMSRANAELVALTNPSQIAEAKRNIRIIAQGILADDAAIQRVRGEIEEVERRFDADAARLRQLLRDPDAGR